MGTKRPVNGVGNIDKKISCLVRQNSHNFFFFCCVAISCPLLVNFSESETTSFHYFSPKDSESLNILDILIWEVGTKIRLNGTSKVNWQADTHMDKLTYRKHWPRGPMLWKNTFCMSGHLSPTQTATVSAPPPMLTPQPCRVGWFTKTEYKNLSQFKMQFLFNPLINGFVVCQF